MDVHRCRFVPYSPSALNAIAFTHNSPSSSHGKPPSTLRLAIGRANGDIELWNPSKGTWFQETILRGGKDRSIEGLVWIQDPTSTDKHGYRIPGKLRLFSTGYSTAVTEWDLAAGKPARHSTGNYGEIWCMAAQPKAEVSSKADHEAEEQEDQIQNIAVGCADGAIVLLSTADNDLHFTRIVARASKKGARVLSLAFQDRHTIIAGHADSTIRVFDLRKTGLQTRNMTLGAGPKGGPREILVWSVKCLADGSIISGDSTGTVCFWDARTYSLVQRIKAHDADILDVTVSADGQTAFSGGMDRKTISYKRSGERSRWVKVSHTRMHDHDVKAMASYEGKNLSILASGGLDTNPIIMPIRELGKEDHRTLSSLPQQENVLSVPRRRLLVSWWDREISIWKIPRREKQTAEADIEFDVHQARGRILVAKVALQGDESITGVDISQDGSILAVSTIAEIKAFKLRPSGSALKVQKLAIPLTLQQAGAKMLKFSPNGRWLSVVRPSDVFQLFRCSPISDPQQSSGFLENGIILKRLARNAARSKPEDGSLGRRHRSINRIAFSANSDIVATTDLSGYLDTWVLDGNEDLSLGVHNGNEAKGDDSADSSSEASKSDNEEVHPVVIFGQHWIRNPSAKLLPKLPNTPLVLSFRPSLSPRQKHLTNGHTTVHPTRHNPHPHSHDLPQGEDRLLVVTAENRVFEFSVSSGRLSEWSRRNPSPTFPQKFQDLRDQTKGALWHISEGVQRLWLYGVNWLWMFDLSRDMQPSTPAGPEADSTAVSLKRKRPTDGTDDESGRGRGTGAGSKIRLSKMTVGIGRKMQKIEGDTEQSTTISLERPRDPDSDDEMVGTEQYPALLELRRGNANGANGKTVDNDMDVDGHDPSSDELQLARREDEEKLPYWFTFKYRPILGIVPLDNYDSARGVDDGEDDTKNNASRNGLVSSKSAKAIEVALIERPLWDMDLPPRFHGDQEWDA